AVRSGAVDPPCQTFEHVADVAEKRVGNRRRIDPAGARFHLQAPGVVLAKNRQQSVVSMFAHAPRGLSALRRSRMRVVEDAKQNEWVARVALSEIVLVQPQA